MSFRGLVLGLVVLFLSACGGQGVPGNGTAPSGGSSSTLPTGEGTYLIAGVVSGATTGTTSVMMTPASGVAISTNTDANGAYSFSLPALGNYTVAPINPSYSFAPSQSTISVTPATTGRASINFSATSSYSISGVVGGAVSSGVQVVVYGTGSGSPNITTTDGNGFYKVAGLYKGSYTVIPNQAGYSFNPTNAVVTISNNSAAGNNYTSAVNTNGPPIVNASISGTVVGAATGGVTVNLYSTNSAIPQTTTTDASGFFMFVGLSGGTYTIIPSLAGFSFSPASGSVTVTTASSAGNNFSSVAGTQLATNNKLSGMISGAIGPGVTIILHGPSGQLSTVSDATGYFEFIGLTNGSYTAVPVLNGYSFNPSSSIININGANYAGANFSSVAGTIVTTKTLSGIVTGEVVQGVTVNLYGTQTGTAVSDANGYYEFTGLSDGPYTMIPTMAGAGFTPASRVSTISGASVASQNFTSIKTLHAIKGTIPNLPGVTMTLAGPIAASATSDSVGNYIFSNLANGNYIITPSRPQYTFNPTSSTVSVNSADSAGVDFVPTFIAIPTYSITGHITNRQGLAGNTITLSGAANATSITDSTGYYQFIGLVAGDYTVTPSSAYPNVTYNPAASTITLARNEVRDFTGYDTININIASNSPNRVDADVKTLLFAAGWDGVTPIFSNITIASGATVYASLSANAALTIKGVFPAGSQITITNNGNIVGYGGAGGAAGSCMVDANTWVTTNNPPGNGSPGGTGLSISSSAATFIVNNGLIAGGGNGGAGTAAVNCSWNAWSYGTVGGVGAGRSGVLTPIGNGSALGVSGAATSGAANATWTAIGTITGAQN